MHSGAKTRKLTVVNDGVGILRLDPKVLSPKVVSLATQEAFSIVCQGLLPGPEGQRFQRALVEPESTLNSVQCFLRETSAYVRL